MHSWQALPFIIGAAVAVPTLVHAGARLAKHAREGRGAPVSIITPRGSVDFEAQDNREEAA